MIPQSHLLSSTLFWTCLKWLVVISVWGALTVGIYRKDHTHRQLLSKPLQNEEISILFKMLYKRILQLGILVTLLIIIVAAGDIHRDMMADSVPLSGATVMPAITETTPLTTNTQAESASNLPTPSVLPYLDITEFNEKDSKEQAFIDMLKDRYENWIVTYYYLKKCGKAEAQDFIFIQSAMNKELDSLHADSSVAGNILTAAKGSYEEMYSEIPCDSAHLATSKVSYDANLQQIKIQSPPAGDKKP